MCCENFALYHNKRLLYTDPCCCSVIKEFSHAFSCAYIELLMHLRSLESTQKARVALSCTQKARVALSCTSSYSYAFFVLSKLPMCIYYQTLYTHAKHKQILKFLPFGYCSQFPLLTIRPILFVCIHVANNLLAFSVSSHLHVKSHCW